MLVLGGTYKVSFRGHADKDEVIANSNLFSLRPLLGSGMYGPPTGFSYTKAPWVSGCFIEASVPNSFPHPLSSWWESQTHTHPHTQAGVCTHTPHLNFYLSISIPGTLHLLLMMFIMFIFSRDRKTVFGKEYWRPETLTVLEYFLIKIE